MSKGILVLLGIGAAVAVVAASKKNSSASASGSAAWLPVPSLTTDPNKRYRLGFISTAGDPSLLTLGTLLSNTASQDPATNPAEYGPSDKLPADWPAADVAPNRAHVEFTGFGSANFGAFTSLRPLLFVKG